jgi:hypothetical protein
MTDRDFFAAAALAGYLANPHVPDRIKDNIAFNAFAEADLMIEERPKDLTPIKPNLTDEELAALAWGLNWLSARFGMDENPVAHRDIAILRKLLERMT